MTRDEIQKIIDKRIKEAIQQYHKDLNQKNHMTKTVNSLIHKISYMLLKKL